MNNNSINSGETSQVNNSKFNTQNSKLVAGQVNNSKLKIQNSKLEEL